MHQLEKKLATAAPGRECDWAIDNHGTRDIPDFSDFRCRIIAVIDEVRTIQALENDLIFE